MKSFNLEKVYEGKKVLVAGASGMTGHNLFNFMQSLCADVVGTYHKNTERNADMQSIFCNVDFTSAKETERFFYDFKFDYVFICCAKTYNAMVCEENPESMVLPNIQMVSNILSNCLKHRVKKTMYMSSATVYQPHQGVIMEGDIDFNINPYDIYMGVGWMKRYAEKLCEFYHHLGLDINVVRPTNIYGRYDKTDPDVAHVIPALIMRALGRQDPYKVHGTGKPVKNFIHVDDLCRDMAMVAGFHGGVSPINLCGDEDITIARLVEMILKESGYNPQVKYLGAEDKITAHLISRNYFDYVFGRQTYKPMKDGIKDVVEWYSLLRQMPKK